MRAAILFAALVLAACGRPAETPAPVAPSKPAIDAERLKSRLAPEQTLHVIETDGPVTGRLEGWRAPVYAVAVTAGQTLSVSLDSQSPNVAFNVGDAADTSGAALHRSDVDGPRASLKPAADTIYFIAPYQPRAMARRGEAADFTLTVSRD